MFVVPYSAFLKLRGNSRKALRRTEITELYSILVVAREGFILQNELLT